MKLATRRLLRKITSHGIMHIVLIVGGVVFSMPFMWLLVTCFKGPQEIFHSSVFDVPECFKKWPLDWNEVFGNFIRAQRFIPFWQWIWNTSYVAFLNVVLNVISSAFVAFGFSRIRWRGRDIVFIMVLATMMLPAQVTMIPGFLIFNWMGWYNTLNPLWFGAFFGGAFHIFLLRQFMMTLPIDLDDAAKIDGCGYFRIFSTITLPLIKPALAVVAVQTFQGAWNNFLGPYIFIITKDKMTISLGLQWFKGDFASMYGELMATTLLMTLPVIFLFFFCQRYMIQGISLTGLKN